MKPKVYLETSIISYLAARPSRNVVAAAMQKITWEWWDRQRSRYDIFVSDVVFREVSQGDGDAARHRLTFIEEIPSLAYNTEAGALATLIVRNQLLPSKAIDDATHIAIASYYRINYLLTWNCKHLANLEILKNVDKLLSEEGYTIPYVYTPFQMVELKNEK